MDDKKPEQTTNKPGLPEALHPEIGNGALLEAGQHHALLRTPDPLKALDALLFTDEITPGFQATDSGGMDQVPPEATTLKEDLQVEVQQENEPGTPSLPEKAEETGTEPAEEEIPAPLPFEEKEPEKTPKPGKRIRKAAKAVRKNEKSAEAAEAPEKPEKPEPSPGVTSSLSPYTQWLKSLKGSEYVHPYDDDFAIEQVSGPAREGISETFADLLAAQGYKDQAIGMYQKLIEKYPEKSGFFAAKIKALE